ncbi:MAG: anhydro-N-acetylmuramic acid kinase [Nitrospinae bacterium]|nr:anhydro-N-acetylmuramic acid kinase [Nitrospinota bacterium]
MTICVGLMSGTSMDGVDAVACDIRYKNGVVRIKPIAHFKKQYPEQLRERLYKAASGLGSCLPGELCLLNTKVGEAFASSANALMKKRAMQGVRVEMIGSHGQTICHIPEKGATMQIGSGALIAVRTGVRTWSDFRSADVARGGEGAPLAPVVHAALFGDKRKNVTALNIGGIANLTHLPAGETSLTSLLAYDTGPGNMLIDHAARKARVGLFDKDGASARKGVINEALLRKLLSHGYFRKKPPKSTGAGYFGAAAFGEWANMDLDVRLNRDILATFTELTARSVALEIEKLRRGNRPTDRLVICGGGAKNGYLVERIAANLGGVEVTTSDRLGVPSDMVEGMLMALLAWYADNGVAVDLSKITGARGGPAILGTLAPA